MAREYISTYGLGDHIGLYDSDGTNRSMHSKLSESSKERIDKEIEHMIKEALNTVLKFIRKNMDQLTIIAELLIHLKTIDQKQLKEKIQLKYE